MIEIRLETDLTQTECIAELSCRKRDGSMHRRRYHCTRYEVDSAHRAELKAVAAGLREIRCPAKVLICLKTPHSVAAINQDWVRNWEKNGWKNQKGKLVRDWELWKEIMELSEEKNLQLGGINAENR